MDRRQCLDSEGVGQRRTALRRGRGHGRSPAPPMDDYAGACWVQAYDAKWLGQDWVRLARYFAVDVNLAPLGSTRIGVGRRAVIVHLREFLARASARAQRNGP